MSVSSALLGNYLTGRQKFTKVKVDKGYLKYIFRKQSDYANILKLV